jgi:outer membrane receptor for ferrienterochelin and colicins
VCALSPIVQLRHALDAKPQGGQDVVRIAIARSQRVPDIGALMPRYAFNGSYERDVPNTPLAPDSAGNPLLKPERVLSAEVSVEKYLRGGGVLSASVFQRRIADLIRRQIALETVAEAPVPRWVSRPSNIGRAQSTGLQLEVKGRGEDLAPFVFEPKSGATLRAALSIYRSRIEQIDDPDARLDGQPPWAANLGLDQRLPKSIFGWGASLALGPGFSTQQTDRQRIWRRHTRRLDAYAVWRFDRLTNLRIAAVNLGAPDSFTTSSVQDEDGFVSTSRSRRTTNTQWTATLTHRF